MAYNIKYISSAGYDFYSTTTTTVSGGIGKGTIQMEDSWQLISIPIQYGYWNSTTHKHIHDDTTVAKFKNYVLDQITDLHGVSIVEVANTFTGDAQMFYSYVVGSTPESSPHNFSLCYEDGVNKEFAGFWIKIIGPNSPYTIKWGE